MPCLLQLARDNIIDVVYAFAKHYVDFRLSLSFGDSELQSEFRGILNYFLETDNKILVQYSFSSDEKINKLYQEFYNSAAEAKENNKIKAESDIEKNEIMETKNANERKKAGRKLTIAAPRGSSHNPAKRHSLGEIDKTELSKVIQKVNSKKKPK